MNDQNKKTAVGAAEMKEAERCTHDQFIRGEHLSGTKLGREASSTPQVLPSPAFSSDDRHQS